MREGYLNSAEIIESNYRKSYSANNTSASKSLRSKKAVIDSLKNNTLSLEQSFFYFDELNSVNINLEKWHQEVISFALLQEQQYLEDLSRFIKINAIAKQILENIASRKPRQCFGFASKTAQLKYKNAVKILGLSKIKIQVKTENKIDFLVEKQKELTDKLALLDNILRSETNSEGIHKMRTNYLSLYPAQKRADMNLNDLESAYNQLINSFIGQVEKRIFAWKGLKNSYSKSSFLSEKNSHSEWVQNFYDLLLNSKNNISQIAIKDLQEIIFQRDSLYKLNKQNKANKILKTPAAYFSDTRHTPKPSGRKQVKKVMNMINNTKTNLTQPCTETIPASKALPKVDKILPVQDSALTANCVLFVPISENHTRSKNVEASKPIHRRKIFSSPVDTTHNKPIKNKSNISLNTADELKPKTLLKKSSPALCQS